MALLLLLLLPLRYIQPTPKSPEGPTQQEVGKVIPMVFIRCIFRTENTKWPNLNSFRRPIPPTGVSLPSFLAPTSLQGGVWGDNFPAFLPLPLHPSSTLSLSSLS